MDLQTYNRYLLAAGGTLAALLLLVGLGALALNFAQDLWPDRRMPTNPVSPEQARDAAERGERLALLSEGTPVLYDTARTRYLLPISQVLLNEPERYRRDRSGEFSVHMEEIVIASRNGPPQVNFVLFDARLGTRRALFDDRLVILDHRLLEDDGTFTLYASVARNDTDDSGLLARGDVESLVRIALPDGRPEVLADSLGRFVSLRTYHDGNLLAADTRVRDPQEWNAAPKRTYRINRSTGAVEPLVPDATRERMQAVLDGRE